MEKENLEFQVQTEDIDELRNDWYTICAKFITETNIESVKEELELLAELEQSSAIILWYRIFSVGDNLKIDEIVDSYPNANEVEMRVDCLAIDKARAKTDQERAEFDIKIDLGLKAITKRDRNIKHKIKNKKEILKFLAVGHCFEKEEQLISELNNILDMGCAHVSDIVKLFAGLEFKKIKLKPEQKKIIKQVAKRKYSDKFQKYINEKQKAKSINFKGTY